MSRLSRRNFLQRVSLMGGVGVVLAGCGGSSDDSMPAEEVMPVEEAGEGASMAEEGFSCMDTSGMAEADITMRNMLQYTDVSETEGQDCKNCQLYVMPVEGQNCGTCTTVKGPIHPGGWCTIWAAQTG